MVANVFLRYYLIIFTLLVKSWCGTPPCALNEASSTFKVDEPLKVHPYIHESLQVRTDVDKRLNWIPLLW